MVALPASAAPAETAVTNVTVTGLQSEFGADICNWRVELAIEGFKGGGRTVSFELWSPDGSDTSAVSFEGIPVKGKTPQPWVYEFVQVISEYPAVERWVVQLESKKGLLWEGEGEFPEEVTCTLLGE